MSDGTKIEWTEATWNPITGCSVTSPGCTNCYAMKLAGTRLRDHPSRAGLTQETKAGPVWTGEVRFNEGWLDQPLRWKRPRMIFVCAHGDLFHESVPNEWIDRVFAVMALCPQHTFQLLTKRSARMREYFAGDQLIERIDCEIDLLITERVDPLARRSDDLRATAPLLEEAWPLPNVWLGVSVEDQARADERIPDLLATPTAVRWLSCEPLLGPVSFRWLPGFDYKSKQARGLSINEYDGLRSLDWIVAGGESGPGARPMHPDWARSLREQCEAAGVPFFFKQWGRFAPFEHLSSADWHGDGALLVSRDGRTRRADGVDLDPSEEAPMIPSGKKDAGRLLDGVEHNAMPVLSGVERPEIAA